MLANVARSPWPCTFVSASSLIRLSVFRASTTGDRGSTAFRPSSSEKFHKTVEFDTRPPSRCPHHRQVTVIRHVQLFDTRGLDESIFGTPDLVEEFAGKVPVPGSGKLGRFISERILKLFVSRTRARDRVPPAWPRCSTATSPTVRSTGCRTRPELRTVAFGLTPSRWRLGNGPGPRGRADHMSSIRRFVQSDK